MSELAFGDLVGFEIRQSGDDVKRDLELVHVTCGEILCDAEPGDTPDVLARMAVGHTCGEGTELACTECGAPAGQPCDVTCIADQAQVTR